MKPKSLFGICADYVTPSNEALADAISEHSTRACDEHRAERIRLGREPVPPYAWSAIKALYSEHCPKADKIIQFLKRTGKSRLFVTEADMQNSEMRETLIRTILQLPGDMRPAYDPYAPSTADTWGAF